MVCCTKEGHKAKQLSLDGLLDYMETDTQEKTFEISLFAETFMEMLQVHYGGMIFESLKQYTPQAPESTHAGSAAKRTAEMSAEPEAKRQKVEEGQEAVPSTEPAKEGVETEPAETAAPTEAKKEAAPSRESSQVPETEKKVVSKRKISDRLLLAFRFFDRNEVSYIKSRDLAEILEFVNQETSSKLISEMTEKLCTESNKIFYEELAL